LKILATIASIISTAIVLIESLRRGLFLASIIFSIAKIAVILLFSALLLIILYLLLTSRKPTPAKD
jgi:hypothetical protein